MHIARHGNATVVCAHSIYILLMGGHKKDLIQGTDLFKSINSIDNV